MKLDEVTIAVLKNFQSINSSIQISEGDTIITMAESQTVLARAVVPNQFPQTFCIHDLKRFLSVASTFKNAELEFSENYLTFVEGNKRIRYTYCDPEVLELPKKKPGRFPPADVFFQFHLAADMLTEVKNGMSVLGHDGIVIKGEDGRLLLSTVTETNSDLFVMDIGETDCNFNFIFESEKLNFIPRDYNVTLSRKKHMHLESENLEYWVASNKNSTIEE